MSFAWTENQILSWTDTTPAKTVSTTADIDLNASTVYLTVNVQIEIIWGASGDGNATVEFLTSPDGGTTVDTLAFYSASMPYTAGATKRQSFQFQQVPWLRVKVTNNNIAVQDITVSGKWCGLYN